MGKAILRMCKRSSKCVDELDLLMDKQYQIDTQLSTSKDFQFKINSSQQWLTNLKTTTSISCYLLIHLLNIDQLDLLSRLQWSLFYSFGLHRLLIKKEQKWEKLLISIFLIIGYFQFIKGIWLILQSIGSLLKPHKKH